MKIPNPLKRRHLVEQDLDPKQALALADAYLAEDRVAEALDFLTKADARDRLEELRTTAIERGDVFLLRDVSQRLGEDPTAGDWEATARAAAGAGKETYAVEARRMADARR